MPSASKQRKNRSPFRVAMAPVTKRGKKLKQSETAVVQHSPPSVVDDPRFQGQAIETIFDALEREHNLDALSRKHMRRAIATVHQHLMQPLTGHAFISEADRNALDKIVLDHLSMLGIATYPWILAYMGPLLIGSRMRKFGKNPRRVEYKGAGEQKLTFWGLDGLEREIYVPEKIQLYYSDNGVRPVFIKGAPVEFPVSQKFAHGIIEPFFQGPQLTPSSAAAKRDTKKHPRFKKKAPETLWLNFGS